MLEFLWCLPKCESFNTASWAACTPCCPNDSFQYHSAISDSTSPVHCYSLDVKGSHGLICGSPTTGWFCTDGTFRRWSFTRGGESLGVGGGCRAQPHFLSAFLLPDCWQDLIHLPLSSTPPATSPHAPFPIPVKLNRYGGIHWSRHNLLKPKTILSPSFLRVTAMKDC